jgi:pyrroloquinoline quinone biosynthesis protein D
VAERLILTEDLVLNFPRHVTFRHDAIRDRWVILAPERLLLPDDTAVEILQRMDGKRTIAQIIDLLAVEFNAPRPDIAVDVVAMLQDLVDKGMVLP